jgi:hypothetical protein
MCGARETEWPSRRYNSCCTRPTGRVVVPGKGTQSQSRPRAALP